jgi:hypothetical protein
MTRIKLPIKKRKRKKKRRSSAELHEVLPVLKLFKDKKPEKVLPTPKLVKEKKTEKKEIKTVSEQSQNELEPITSPMSDE